MSLSVVSSWPGMRRVSPEFLLRLIHGAEQRGWDPDGLLGHISSESGFDASAKNPHASASGLIQVTDATARALGFRDAAQVRSMSAETQLERVVFPFFEMMGGPYLEVGDYKIAGFGKRPSVSDSAVVIEPEHVGINPGFTVDPHTGAVLAGAVREWARDWEWRFPRGTLSDVLAAAKGAAQSELGSVSIVLAIGLASVSAGLFLLRKRGRG